MTDEQYYNQLVEIVENGTNGRKTINYTKVLRCYYPELLKWINEQTPLLQDPKYKMSTKIYWVIHRLKDFPVCETCGKKFEDKNVYTLKDGYSSRFCSMACCNRNEELKLKRQHACEVKYGCKASSQNENVKAKMKETCAERYINGHQSRDYRVREKSITTCKLKYNVEHPTQSDQVKEKIKQTNLERYGVENPLQNKEIREKSKKTNLERYGVEYSSQRPEIKEKIKQTNLERRNVEYVLQDPEVIEKSKITRNEHIKTDENYLTNIILKREETCNQIYNCKNPMQCKEVQDKYRITNSKNMYHDFLNSETIPLFTEDDFIQYILTNLHEPLKWKCTKCNNVFEDVVNGNFRRNHKLNVYARCLKCYPHSISGSSIEEKEVINFIKTIYSNIVEENKTSILKVDNRLELDIYLPELNLAFEFDGLIWHSENNKINFLNKDYKTVHVNKTNYCLAQNIQLIHIFENEWILKRNIVEDKIKRLLNAIERKVKFKQCELRNVDNEIAKQFQEENNLQMSIENATINLGLYFNNELISIMCFNQLNDILYDWELANYCEKIGITVINGYKEILKYFIKNFKPISIVTSVDRRWSNGKEIEQIGFKLETVTEPNCWHFNFKDRILYKRNDEESDSKIYDSGNLIYVWRSK